jgi:4-hydroxy-3-methylbut-2-enyl diphosphate reductase
MALSTPNVFPAPIFTYGPLIHNNQVLNLLAEKGIHPIDTLPAKGEGTMIIRAHGISPQDQKRIEAVGFQVLDATCPRVKKVQVIIERYSRRDNGVVIIGDQNHAEVVGLMGYAGNHGVVAESLAALDELPSFSKAIIVAQTTQNTEFFKQVQSWAGTHRPQYEIFNTICDSTEKRQAEVREMADSVDAFVIIGGRNSGNTCRLAEIAQMTRRPAFHVETEADLDIAAMEKFSAVGITAGASTPPWVTEKVCSVLNKIS